MKKLTSILTVILFVISYQSFSGSFYKSVACYNGPYGNDGSEETVWVDGSQIQIDMAVSQGYLAPSYYYNNDPSKPMYAFGPYGYASNTYKADAYAWGLDDYSSFHVSVTGQGSAQQTFNGVGDQTYSFIVWADYGSATINAYW